MFRPLVEEIIVAKLLTSDSDGLHRMATIFLQFHYDFYLYAYFGLAHLCSFWFMTLLYHHCQTAL